MNVAILFEVCDQYYIFSTGKLQVLSQEVGEK
jgi:hypothetical protein